MPLFNLINILLIHIPKTGGTSIENYFYNKFNIKRTLNTLYSDLSLILNSHSLQHSTFNELFEKKEYYDIDFNNIKIISVIRNPYERIISDLFYNGLINLESTKDEIFSKISWFLNSTDLIYDNHKMEQYKYLIGLDGKINNNIIIMRIETLNDDMIKNGFDDFNVYDQVSYRNKINYIGLLNNDSIKLINNFYQKDFEYFNYEIIKII